MDPEMKKMMDDMAAKIDEMMTMMKEMCGSESADQGDEQNAEGSDAEFVAAQNTRKAITKPRNEMEG